MLGARETMQVSNDCGKVGVAAVGVDHVSVEVGDSGTDRECGVVGGGSVEGESKILVHEAATEAGLEIAIGRARRYDVGDGGVGGHGPALGRGRGGDGEEIAVVETQGFGKGEAFADGDHLNGHHQIVAKFRGGAAPGAADFLRPSHRSQDDGGPLEVAVAGAHHEGQRPSTGSRDAAGHGRVDHGKSFVASGGLELPGRAGRDRRTVDEERLRVDGVEENPGEDLLHLFARRQRRHHRRRAGSCRRRRRRHLEPFPSGNLSPRRRAIEARHVEAFLYQILRHWQPHPPHPDECHA
mmetsp:Transcript_10704/g.27245  ORF Transcript_10704/g.27245 Transcript_10704/m.27245 type:complete len:296 (+) Transcript_10704:21-908(+)